MKVDAAVRPEPLRESPRLEEGPRVTRRHQGRRRLLAILAGVAALALILLGVQFWLSSRTREGTDDAQVVGHIIPVLSRASGYVRTVLVSENQRVHAGDVLVQLDDRDLIARLRQAEANLTLAQTSTGPSGEAAADVAAARAAVAQARAEAERTANQAARSRDLLAQNAIARQDVENDAAAARAAAAALRAAQSRTEAAVAGARGSNAKVAAAIAERDEAALQASYARIIAPHDGIVSKKSVEVGQLVQPGQALLAVVPLDSVWVIANFKETQIDDMKPGESATVRADTYHGREFRGHVESLSPATGATFSLLPPENATGNFVKVVQRVPVKIAIDEPQDPAHLLRPGMSVHVSVRTQG